MENGNNRLRFGNYEAKKTLKVFVWSFGSALIAGLLSYFSSSDVPVEWLTYVPLVNVVLYALKEVFAENR